MPIQCPPLLPDYQQFMRGVDRGDQLLQHRETLQEMVFSHVIECSVLNSYVLESHAKPVEHALRGHQKRDFLRF